MQAVVVGPLREAQYRAGCRRAAAALQLSSGALFSLQTSHSVQRRQVAAAAEPSSVPPAASGGSGSGDGSSGGASQAAPVVQIEYRGRALQVCDTIRSAGHFMSPSACCTPDLLCRPAPHSTLNPKILCRRDALLALTAAPPPAPANRGREACPFSPGSCC